MHRYCLIVPFLLTISTWAAEPVYVETVTVPPETSAEKIVEMAAHVVPHPRQMIWHRDEFISFIHFGVNTFTGAEWGSGNEDPNIFNPEELDTDQWCEVMKEAGITRVILTVKHHDGFCLWQTRYVKHAVTASTKWRNGKGDVLRDLAESCEKYGLRLGVYLSPADRYMKNTKLYGNGSSIRKENVPSWVAGRPFADTRSFTYELDDYNLYFMNQMFELLTEYGHIYEVWFDGAAASGNTQKYNRTAWFDLIRRLAPDAMIAVKGPDTRWCGNEAGGTRESEFNVAGLRMDHIDHEEWNDNQYAGQSRSKLKEAKALHYYPAETNTSIRHGWFYRDDEHQEVRTADDVFDIYERAVGGNSVFLLNIPPNTKGTFSDRDVETLLETGKRIRAVYGHSVSEKAVAPANVLDGDDTTYWQADGQAGELVVRFPTPVTLNRLVLQEALSVCGQRVEKHVLDAWLKGEWAEISAHGAIGYKRIHRFKAVTTDKLRVRILEARAPATISTLSAHFYDEPPFPVQIRTDSNNRIDLVSGVVGRKGGFSSSKTQNIHYTLDGSDPTAASPVYSQRISLPDGGIIKARTITNGRLGVMTTKLLGLPRAKWQVVATDSIYDERRNQPGKALDGRSHAWLSSDAEGEHFFTVDMGRKLSCIGFTYTPPQDKNKRGCIESYRFEGSGDGTTWQVVKSGTLGNIINDPSKRIIHFEDSETFRYFKLIGVKAAQGNMMGIDEIQILGRKQ